MRFVLYAIADLLFLVVSLLLAPVLPLFASPREGRCDNGNRVAVEPRLPQWLAWFQTPDNSLWGDHGWQTEHCPDHYRDWWGMTRWLWRNHGYGFAWSVLAAPVVVDELRLMSGYPDIKNRRNAKAGRFFIRMGEYWQWKFIWQIPRTEYCVMLNFGWLLDAYWSNPVVAKEQPRALFVLSPRISAFYPA